MEISASSARAASSWLVEDYAVPIVAVNFSFAGGTSQDPADRPGLANMLSGLLDEGAGELDSKAFQAKLDDLSIGLSFDTGRDDFFGTLKTLAENKDEAFSMLASAVQDPRASMPSRSSASAPRSPSASTRRRRIRAQSRAPRSGRSPIRAIPMRSRRKARSASAPSPSRTSRAIGSGFSPAII